jgi:hypothetical protein
VLLCLLDQFLEGALVNVRPQTWDAFRLTTFQGLSGAEAGRGRAARVPAGIDWRPMKGLGILEREPRTTSTDYRRPRAARHSRHFPPAEMAKRRTLARSAARGGRPRGRYSQVA